MGENWRISLGELCLPHPDNSVLRTRGTVAWETMEKLAIRDVPVCKERLSTVSTMLPYGRKHVDGVGVMVVEVR